LEDFTDLLRRAQGSDEVAFNCLFRSVQPILLRYLATMASPHSVDDVAAETWIAVIRGLDRFVGDDIGAFRAWVLSIARRRWVDDVRRKSRRPEVLSGDSPDVQTSEDPAVAVDMGMSTEHAIALIRTLPPDQAEVVLLRVIGDLDVAATAKLVGKSEGAVRVLAHRGLRKLAAVLGSGVTKPRPGAVDE
jgi:RNA polymerase sigma-70 factor (ECF subfamily)